MRIVSLIVFFVIQPRCVEKYSTTVRNSKNTTSVCVSSELGYLMCDLYFRNGESSATKFCDIGLAEFD